MISLIEGQTFNPLAFIYYNRIVNENGMPIEFKQHRFLIDPYMDMSEEQVALKCGQVGWSTLAIIKTVWLSKYKQANIIYTMPSRNSMKEFVMPKVDPIIAKNPVLSSWMGRTDNVQLKQVGDRFIYYRGSWEPDSAISISAHILVNDEKDRSNQKTLRTFHTRLDAAKMDRPDLGWRWEFSNPSIPGYGVDETYQLSDQKEWFVKCRWCSYEDSLKFPDNVDVERELYICSKCHNIISDEARRRGRWVAKYPTRSISGYWLSQLMVPWIPAKKIIRESRGDQQVFYNFTLGLPYVSKDETVSRQVITNNISPDINPRTNVAIGVDNGIVKHYVVGNRYGIFMVGHTESWEEIEDLRNRYNAVMVMDMMPYPNTPQKLIKAYPGKCFGNYFVQDKKTNAVIHWGEGDKRGIVESDRTRIIDLVVADLNAGDITFHMTLTELEEYIYHWGQLYRTVKQQRSIDGGLTGIVRSVWESIEGKPDHYAFATLYWRIALEKTLTQGGVVTSAPTTVDPKTLHPYVSPDLTMPALNVQEIARASLQKHKDWKTT